MKVTNDSSTFYQSMALVDLLVCEGCLYVLARHIEIVGIEKTKSRDGLILDKNKST